SRCTQQARLSFLRHRRRLPPASGCCSIRHSANLICSADVRLDAGRSSRAYDRTDHQPSTSADHRNSQLCQPTARTCAYSIVLSCPLLPLRLPRDFSSAARTRRRRSLRASLSRETFAMDDQATWSDFADCKLRNHARRPRGCAALRSVVEPGASQFREVDCHLPGCRNSLLYYWPALLGGLRA